jgi:RHS repeat-associated protein
VYLAGGEKPFAAMNGSSLSLASVPLPGGGFAIYNSSGAVSIYTHSDWLGSPRLRTTPSQTLSGDSAVAPYGETYALSGNSWSQFTTNGNQWTVSGLDDFLYRRYHPNQGRWISPDPAGLAAVDPSNPQSWNRYAYVMNNPLGNVDPLGLCPNVQIPGHCVEVQEKWLSIMADYGVYVDGVSVDASLAQSLLDVGAAVQCPNNVCGGWGDDGRYGEFYAFAGGTSGYFNSADLTHGIDEVAGMIMNDTQYNAYVQVAYASQIDAQRQALASAIAANSGGKISYEDAYESLNPAGGHLQGGNYNFVEKIYGPSNLVCGTDRCNGVHFPAAGFAHLDTSNPFAGPVGFFQHAFVDVFLGNIAYTVVPRPWP